MNELLINYMKNYFGFGDPEQADYWFIGVEDGGGYIRERTQAWEKRGCANFVRDIDQFHDEMLSPQLNRWFRGENPTLQKTWTRLIACLLALKGDEVNEKKRKHFQKNHLGRKDNLIAELWPLPFPLRLSELVGEKLPEDIDLQFDKGKYSDNFTKFRVKNIREFVKKYRPKLVVVYGKDPCKYFGNNLANFEFENRDGTIWAAAPHPRGTSLENWVDLGKRLRKKLA
ncbi:MAG: hypothetical protein PHF37_02270 [Phycisphaerae bacterium]|nr:hypothetical protein [Phycisphaerae bacterium]